MRPPSRWREARLADGREPRLVAAYATLLARLGGDEALGRAIKICDEALAGVGREHPLAGGRSYARSAVGSPGA